MSEDPSLHPCIVDAGLGALVTFRSFPCPKHWPAGGSREGLGPEKQNPPPGPCLYWSLSSRQGLGLFTPNFWWQERSWGDLTSCGAWKCRVWQMYADFSQPAARHAQAACRTLQHRDLEQNVAKCSPWNRCPPPPLACHDQLQGKIYTVWVEKKERERELYPKHGWFWGNYFSVRIYVAWGSAHKLDKQATLVLSDCISIIGQWSFLFIQRKVEFDWQGRLPARKWLFPPTLHCYQLPFWIRSVSNVK